MYAYRLSIEDPLRTPESHADDYWCSFCQVGDTFHGKVLTMEEYVRVESIYVDFVSQLLGSSMNAGFRVRFVAELDDLDLVDNRFRKVVSEMQDMDRARALVCPSKFADFLKANLRRRTWCRFDWDDGSRVRVKYDYCAGVLTPHRFEKDADLGPDGLIRVNVPCEVRLDRAEEYYVLVEEDEKEHEEWWAREHGHNTRD